MAQTSGNTAIDTDTRPKERQIPVQEQIWYEQPLNERARVFLRLDHLFRQADYHMQNDGVWESRAVMSCLIDLISVFGRPDLKSELIKELERHSKNLRRMASNPDVDQQRLGQLLSDIENVTQSLYGSKGQIGADLRKHEFLGSITQRSAIPGGTCEFDLPELHHWLNGAPEKRRRDLDDWLSRFGTVHEAVRLILQLTRHSGSTSQECATRGFYQRSLDANLPVQLIRVCLPMGQTWFPEISGGKHRFTIRFMTLGEDGHSRKIEDDVNFGLTCCIL